jgi:Tfp pilus assembly protein PilN
MSLWDDVYWSWLSYLTPDQQRQMVGLLMLIVLDCLCLLAYGVYRLHRQAMPVHEPPVLK